MRKTKQCGVVRVLRSPSISAMPDCGYESFSMVWGHIIVSATTYSRSRITWTGLVLQVDDDRHNGNSLLATWRDGMYTCHFPSGFHGKVLAHKLPVTPHSMTAAKFVGEYVRFEWMLLFYQRY